MENITTNIFELESKVMLVPIATITKLLQQPNGADAIALYIFYYQTAKRQDTNQVRATRNFCEKGLKWGHKRFLEAKAVLEALKLVEIKKSGDKWYTKISYYKSKTSQNSTIEVEPNCTQKQLVDSGTSCARNLIPSISRNAFTNTNVLDDATPKRGTSCPLKNPSNPLKAKYPKGHLECVEYVNSFKFVNKGKQFRFLHQILRSGLDFPYIDKLISGIEKKPYFKENGYDFATVAGEADRRANARI